MLNQEVSELNWSNQISFGSSWSVLNHSRDCVKLELLTLDENNVTNLWAKINKFKSETMKLWIILR